MITALSILKSKETYDKEYSTVSKHDALEAMIEFAKLHVKIALKKVNEECDNEIEKDFINEKLILNSYSLENIK